MDASKVAGWRFSKLVRYPVLGMVDPLLDSDTLSREGSLASEANLDMVLNAVRQYGPKFVIIDEVHNGLLLRISCTLLKLTQDRPPNSLEICLTTHCEESKQLYYS